MKNTGVYVFWEPVVTGKVFWIAAMLLVRTVSGFSDTVEQIPESTRQSIWQIVFGRTITAQAQKQIGVPYRWGGESPRSGFDCSGLVQWIFARYGFNLPREAKDQVRIGNPVARRDLQPGDLIFFQTGWHGISHVGIYCGSDQFVHAPATGKNVCLESLKTQYWARRFRAARRVSP